jgi:hypothetical protein
VLVPGGGHPASAQTVVQHHSRWPRRAPQVAIGGARQRAAGIARCQPAQGVLRGRPVPDRDRASPRAPGETARIPGTGAGAERHRGLWAAGDTGASKAPPDRRGVRRSRASPRRASACCALVSRVGAVARRKDGHFRSGPRSGRRSTFPLWCGSQSWPSVRSRSASCSTSVCAMTHTWLGSTRW